jgi:hypothetical protein
MTLLPQDVLPVILSYTSLPVLHRCLSVSKEINHVSTECIERIHNIYALESFHGHYENNGSVNYSVLMTSEMYNTNNTRQQGHEFLMQHVSNKDIILMQSIVSMATHIFVQSNHIQLKSNPPKDGGCRHSLVAVTPRLVRLNVSHHTPPGWTISKTCAMA